jgi:hypothetical protein
MNFHCLVGRIALMSLALSTVVAPGRRLYGAEQVAVDMTCQDSSLVDQFGTLRIDSSAAAHEFGWRRYAMTAAGFVPGERYRATFRARVAEHGGKAFLYVLVRPKGQSGDEKWHEGSVPLTVLRIIECSCFKI